MNHKNIHCPYCNADLVLSPAEAASLRIHCPRCGDTFPNRPGEQDGGVTVSPPPSSEEITLAGPGTSRRNTGVTASLPPRSPGFKDISLPVPRSTRWSNAAIARLLVAGMAALAVIALVFALATTEFRRSNDLKNIPPPKGLANPPRHLVAPADLLALGYLPADCRVLAGWQLGALQRSENGREFLKQLRASKTDLGLAQVETWTGLKARDMDHLALGIRINEDLLQLLVVLRTRDPYDARKAARAAAPVKPDTLRGQPFYQATVMPFVDRLVWYRDDRTIIIEIASPGARKKDLEDLPAAPRKGIQGFSPSLQQELQHNMLKDAFLWTVGDLKDLPALDKWLMVASAFSSRLPSWLNRVDAVRAALRLDQGITLDAAIKGRDTKSASEILAYLDKHRPEGMKSSVADDTWINLQLHARPEQIAETLRGLPTPLPKQNRQ
jgi:hypothetical protein